MTLLAKVMSTPEGHPVEISLAIQRVEFTSAILYNIVMVLLSRLSKGGINMAKQKHLTLSMRIEIEQGLNLGKSFKQLGRELGKDNTTIAKEVKHRRQFRQIGKCGSKFNDCANRSGCDITNLCGEKCQRPANYKCVRCGLCSSKCSDYKKETCTLLNQPPYVCNGCEKKSRCSLEKVLYEAKAAQKEYEEVLRDSRIGRNFNDLELQQIDDLISPLVKNGQSIHHICVHHADEIMCCERTIYSLVNDNLLAARNLDLPRKVRLRPRKDRKPRYKVDKKCRINRTIRDYYAFKAAHPDIPTAQIDSVEGIKGGPVLLTIHVLSAKLQLAFLRPRNDSQSVIDIFNTLYDKLGREDYIRIYGLLLGDNGSEFSNPSALEFDRNGDRCSWLFYCDPSAPGQKGACENNHTFIRKIIPKGVDIGLYSESQIRLMMNHINSYSRPDLGDKSPYDVFSFLYGKDVLDKLDVERIPSDRIILRPELLNSPAPLC